MAGVKYDFTDEQRKKVKNLTVSANILKADIKKLTEQMEAATDESVKGALAHRVAYKENRMNEKLAEAQAMKDAAGKIPIAYAPRAPKVTLVETGENTTPETDETDL